jgi:CDP-2,3-bis-(O-geranylgeranyl)-sn-glycerol synthase
LLLLFFLDTKLFGKNKTWRGLILGIVVAILVSFIQSKLYPLWSLYDYSNWYSWGFLLGLGALGGDAIESFFKRRMNFLPGEPWIPFDQIDHVIGAMILGSVLFFPGWVYATYLVIVTFFGHLAVNYIAFKLKIRTSRL